MFSKSYYIHTLRNLKYRATSNRERQVRSWNFFCVSQVQKKNTCTEKIWDGSARQVELRKMFQACWNKRIFLTVYRNCPQSPEFYLQGIGIHRQVPGEDWEQIEHTCYFHPSTFQSMTILMSENFLSMLMHSLLCDLQCSFTSICLLLNLRAQWQGVPQVYSTHCVENHPP